MTPGGEMLQLRFYFGERDRVGDGEGPLEAALMDACARRGVSAAALLRGVSGFGAKHGMRTDRLLTLSEDAPLVAVAVGAADVVEELAAEVRGLGGEGLLVLEPVLADVGGAPQDVVKATIWGPRSGSRSPHLGAVEALHRCGAEAATVLLGVDGVLGGKRRRARFVGANRAVPAVTVAVGERAKVEAALREIDAAHLVTVESVVTYCRIGAESHHGEGGVVGSSRIAGVSHHGNVESAASAEATRVTLVTPEAASPDGRPLYLEFVDALRREGAPGATALRGIWGFRGGRTPRGDRVLALRRDVPVMVEVIDTAERAGRWLELALSLAGEDDVVESQWVDRILTPE